MLSKNKIKHIRGLNRKKVRDRENLFLAEGDKLVEEIIQSGLRIETLICTSDFLNRVPIQGDDFEIITANKKEIEKASLQKNPQHTLAVVKKQAPLFSPSIITSDLVLCLDTIQDPGNLGTIVRIADWFGVKNLICAENTVDIYNPKAIQATMGAICRVNIFYSNLKSLIKSAINNSIPVFGTFPNGENIYTESLTSNGLIVMGNEGQGISPEIENMISNRIAIPPFPPGTKQAESLNVATATAIVCSEFRRRVSH